MERMAVIKTVAEVIVVGICFGLAVAFRYGLQAYIATPWDQKELIDLPVLVAGVAFMTTLPLTEKARLSLPLPRFPRDWIGWTINWLVFTSVLHLGGRTTEGLWLRMWLPFSVAFGFLAAICSLGIFNRKTPNGS